MSVIETMIDIPAEHERNVCGQFDAYLKKIERTLHVTMIARDGEIKLIGPEKTIGQAKSVFNNLIQLSMRGNTITEQNVDYALSLSFTENDDQILEIDKDIICRTIMGKPVKPKTLGQKHYVDSIRKKMIVFGIGPAGTGKTYLAMAMAIQAFKNGEVGRIILTLAYMRGRTLDNAYIILDEAQNTTPAQMKMFLTRIGFGSKVIITGDQTQKDLPSGATSGLDTALKVLKNIDDIGFCYLTSSDVVRHPLVQKIVKAYDDYEKKTASKTARGERKTPAVKNTRKGNNR